MKRAADIVVEQIEQLTAERGSVLVVALDGPSGVDNTTIAKQIAERIDAVNVFCDNSFVGSTTSSGPLKAHNRKLIT